MPQGWRAKLWISSKYHQIWPSIIPNEYAMSEGTANSLRKTAAISLPFYGSLLITPNVAYPLWGHSLSETRWETKKNKRGVLYVCIELWVFLVQNTNSKHYLPRGEEPSWINPIKGGDKHQVLINTFNLALCSWVFNLISRLIQRLADTSLILSTSPAISACRPYHDSPTLPPWTDLRFSYQHSKEVPFKASPCSACMGMGRP